MTTACSETSVSRKVGHAPQTRALGRRLGALPGPCVGCRDCQGLCRALIEALTVPETVLRRGRCK